MQKTRINFNDHILSRMRACVLLRTLSDELFEEVVGFSNVYQLEENQTLFEQGSPLTDLYLQISGAVKLLRLVPNGDEKVIDIIQPGQTFAEAALFAGNPRYPVTAVSVSHSVVVAFNAQSYLQLLKSSNDLCISLLGQLSQRLHWMVNEVDRLTLHNATFRLADYLLNQIKEDQNERTALILAAPKNVIASRLSIKPETLSRTLKELVSEGLIELHGSEIELLDVEKLRQLVSLES